MPKAARPTGTTNVRSTREVAERWTPRLTQDGWTPVSDYFPRELFLKLCFS